MRALGWFNTVLAKALAGACGTLGLLIAALMFAQVLIRYLGGTPLSWSEEVIRYLFVWVGFMGAALAQRTRSHVVFDLLESALGRFYVPLRHLVIVLFGGFLVVVVVSGVRFATAGFGVASVALQMPMGYVYLAVPVCGTIMVLFLLEQWIGMWVRAGE